MTARRLGIAAIVTTLTLICAACGGGGEQAVAECDGEITGGTVTMFAHEGSEADAYRAAIDRFNQTRGTQLGVTVDLTMIPEGQYTDLVNTAAAAGDLPAVLDLDGPHTANLAWAGSLIPIEGCISPELRANMLPSLIQQGTYAGTLYSVGSFDSGLGLWAWRSALEEAGARIPEGIGDAWTADEFEQVLRDLQAAGYEHPLDVRLWSGDQGEWFTYAFSPILWSAGGDLINRQGYDTASGALNAEASVAAMSRFQRWIEDGLVDKDSVDDSIFPTKRAPIAWSGHWAYQPYKEAVGDDLVLLPLPDFGEGAKTGMGSWAWGITPAADDPDAAWAVIDYLMSDEAILAITDVNGAIPGTQTAIAKSPHHAEGGDLALYVEQLEAAPNVAVPRPVTPAYPTITQVFRRTIDDVIQGGAVKETLDKATQEINADIEANEGYPPPGSF